MAVTRVTFNNGEFPQGVVGKYPEEAWYISTYEQNIRDGGNQGDFEQLNIFRKKRYMRGTGLTSGTQVYNDKEREYMHYNPWPVFDDRYTVGVPRPNDYYEYVVSVKAGIGIPVELIPGTVTVQWPAPETPTTPPPDNPPPPPAITPVLLSVTPTSVHRGESVTVTGTGEPNGDIQVAGISTATFKFDAQGNLNVAVPILDTIALGKADVYLYNKSTGKFSYDKIQVDVLARTAAQPTIAGDGQLIFQDTSHTFTGAGFAPNSAIAVICEPVSGGRTETAAGISSATGTISAQVFFASSLGIGNVWVSMRDSDGKVSNRVLVSVNERTAPGGPDEPTGNGNGNDNGNNGGNNDNGGNDTGNTGGNDTGNNGAGNNGTTKLISSNSALAKAAPWIVSLIAIIGAGWLMLQK